MISVYKIKPAFQKLLQPVLKALHSIGVTANQLTLAAIALSVGLGYMFLHYEEYPVTLLLLPAGLLLRMALNALDGMMARQFNMQSRLGEILNELGDVLSDLAIIFPLVVIPGLNPIIVVAFGVLAVMNEFAGLMGRALGGERRYEGPMGKSDRALIIGLYCIIAYFWRDVELYADWIFGAASALVVVSTVTRLRKAL
jgi:CDP-diacylglycerol--glycerol-3-phosphate 3-phosphatidyltransferase